MKKASFSLILVVLFSSCKREFARFQSVGVESFAKEKKINPSILAKDNIQYPINDVSEQDIFSQATTEELPVLASNEPEIPLVVLAQTTQKHKQTWQQESTQKPLFGEKKQKKNKNNSLRLNPSIYSGMIILGIAILLALLSLQSLSLLFGLASILFLYWGFKKYFRKQQRKKIF